ncbi:MAG: DUF4199 domain-containing protein [Bacteroidales bacterium]|nr:DUF4199 domain-containing protein [Bacteroidales bacterium]MBQ2097539.1 DUF4199 domain-containing protein [Bacteroidales bacterium]
MISENSHLFWSKSLYWGLEIGSDIVLYCVVAQWLWDRPFDVSGIVPYMILAICIYLCHREFVSIDPKMTFAELLFAGVVAGASGSLIVDLYAAYYVKAYDPAYMEQMIQQSVSLAGQLGYQDGDMTEAMRQMFVPLLMFTTTMVYVFVSLIMSAFGAFLVNLRRKHNNGNNSKQQK